MPCLTKVSLNSSSLVQTNSVDLSVVSVACLALAGGEVRIALGAVAPTPIRVREAESILLGTRDEEAIALAASLAREMAVPISDVRAGNEYRLEMVEVLAKNAIRQALTGLAATGKVE
jgi:CO/xanthine dehydrogenase FAD-binding subunit